MTATVEQWRAAYDAKVAEFAAETRKASALIRALHSMNCRASHVGHGCAGCDVLAEVKALDPHVGAYHGCCRRDCRICADAQPSNLEAQK